MVELTPSSSLPLSLLFSNLSKFGSKALSFGLWNFYWFWTGLFATGLWVIAHECGREFDSPTSAPPSVSTLLRPSLTSRPFLFLLPPFFAPRDTDQAFSTSKVRSLSLLPSLQLVLSLG